MLDFSFGEIFVIAVVAVIFLGPDKLPQAFVKIAKILRAVKKTISDAKDTLDREIHISEMKQDALEYKKKFEDSALKLKDEVLESANLDSIKSELNTIKTASKLNESIDKRSVSFDDIEAEGKKIQNRLKSNLKSKKDSANATESTKIIAKDSSKSIRKTSKKITTKDSVKTIDSPPKRAKKNSDISIKDSAESAKKTSKIYKGDSKKTAKSDSTKITAKDSTKARARAKDSAKDSAKPRKKAQTLK